MALEIANFIHAACLASLQAGSASAFLKQNGFAGSIVRISTGVYVLPLNEKLAYLGSADLPGPVHVTNLGTPARMLSAAIIPSDHVSLSAYAGDVLVQAFDAAGAAVDASGVSVTVERFPTIE